MGRRRTRLDPDLLKLLFDDDMNDFSVIELRDSYAERFGLSDYPDRSELRKWLYRKLLLLVRKGLLVRSTLGEDNAVRYRKSDTFLMEYQSERSEYSQTKCLVPTNSDERSMTVLRARLNLYQVDMLACAGECKEYQQIVEEFPQLKESVEPMYRIARERSSELMGQLRAINNLLHQSAH